MRFFVLTLLLVATAPALASASGRYAFEPAAGGVFRLDTMTGEVALCTARDGALVCVRSPAPAAAPADEADGLAALESRVTALEAEPSGRHAQRDSEALARVKALTKQMMGRLVALVRGMKAEREDL